MRYMLDTDICIYLIKKKSEKLIEKICSFNEQEICISSITMSELYYGAEKSNNPETNKITLMLFLSALSVLDFDAEASKSYGFVRAELEKKGTPIGPLDTMIASHALAAKCVLVTNNISEFSRIEELSVENWMC